MKRFFCVLIALAMLTVLFTGCNKRKPSATGSSQGSLSSKSPGISSSMEPLSSSDVSSGSFITSDWGVDDSSSEQSDDDYTYSIPSNLVSSASSAPIRDVEGLLNASAVGIDTDNFLNEVKYTAPANPDYIIKAVDFGVIANDKKDDTAALQAAIAAAKAKPSEKTKVIQLPKGDIDIVEGFNSIDYRYGIIIDTIDNLSIVGDSTNFYFYEGSLGFKAFHIKNCKNLLFTKISVDWGKPPYVSGEIVSFDAPNRTVVVKVNKGYKVDSTTQVIEYLEYDKDTNLPRDGGNTTYNHNDDKNISGVQYLGDNKLKITFKVSLTQAPIGTRVALAQSMHHCETFIVDACTNLRFETVNLYASPGMGLRSYSSTNLYFNRFNCVLKPNTDRLLTVTADILHLKNTAGEIIITNSTLENSHDDAINVSGHYLRIREISGNRLRVLSPLGVWGTFKPNINDVYEASDINTLEVKKTLTVTKVEDSNDGYWITVKEGTDGLQLNNALANITRTPKLIFKNNLVRNKRNRGILVQTRNVLIENNAFSNISMGAVSLLSEVNIFNESTAPKDVIIRNNKFVNNNTFAEADIGIAAYGPGFSVGSPKAISNIQIENNLMAYSKNAGFSFKGASNIIAKGNLIYNPATAPMEGKYNAAMYLENVSNFTLDGNKIVGGTVFGFKTVFIAGGVDANTISLKNNIGINEGDIFGEQKTWQIDKSNAAINIGDKSLSDWGNNGTVIDMQACTDINVKEVSLSSVPENDFTQHTKFLWKDDGIYFSFDVKDNSLQFNPTQWWLGDGMELFLTTETKSYANTGAVKLSNDDTLQLFMKPDDAGGIVFFDQRTSDTVLSKKFQFKFSFWTDSNGYKGEGFIPFSAMPGLKQSILKGDALAMSVNFGDSDVGNEQINPLDKFMTFSTVRHPTTQNKMIPANMTKYLFK